MFTRADAVWLVCSPAKLPKPRWFRSTSMRASISIRCTPRLSRLKNEQRGRNHPFRVRSEFFEAPAPACNHPKLPTGSSLMFSKNLELSISQAYHTARSKRHEYLDRKSTRLNSIHDAMSYD